MGFNSHGGYYLKDRWMPKFMKLLKREPDFLRNSTTYITDKSGIGTSMLRAIKFYLKLTNITNSNYEFTELGKLLYKYDRYFTEEETKWLLQYYIANNKELAPTLYYINNICKYNEFSKQDIIEDLYGYATFKLDAEIRKSTLEKEFNMIKNLYMERREKNPETTNKSYFEELLLLNKNDGIYSFRNVRAEEIPGEIIYYCIIEWIGEIEGIKQMSMNDLFNKAGSPFKAFHMNILEKYRALDYMKNKKTFRFLQNSRNRCGYI